MDIIFFFLSEKMESGFIILRDWIPPKIVSSEINVIRINPIIIPILSLKIVSSPENIVKKGRFFYNKKDLIFNLNYFDNEKEKYEWLTENYNAFTYDYDKIKETFREINKEIIEKYWHPDNIDTWIDEIDE
jgi:hypothetical protein